MKSILLFFLIAYPLMTLAQQNSYPVPEFVSPSNLSRWKQQRDKIRNSLHQLMGKIPARPALASVTVLSKEEKQGYTVEKFEFDNGAGATVPGYFLLPTSGTGP